MSHPTSLQLILQAPGLHLNTVLRAEALSELMALVQRYRVEEVVPRGPFPRAGGPAAGFRPVVAEQLHRRMPPGGEPISLSADGEVALARFRALPWESLIGRLPGRTFAIKLLLLTAWLEAQRGQAVFKGEVRAHFARTGEPFPANPGRDIRSLVLDGFLAKSADRQHLALTETGWREAVRWLDPGEDGAGMAAVLA